MAEDLKSFNSGLLAALAVVASADAETLYREIVNTADAADLVKLATEEDALDWSGLRRYGFAPKAPVVLPKRKPGRRDAIAPNCQKCDACFPDNNTRDFRIGPTYANCTTWLCPLCNAENQN